MDVDSDDKMVSDVVKVDDVAAVVAALDGRARLEIPPRASGPSCSLWRIA